MQTPNKGPPRPPKDEHSNNQRCTVDAAACWGSVHSPLEESPGFSDLLLTALNCSCTCTGRACSIRAGSIFRRWWSLQGRRGRGLLARCLLQRRLPLFVPNVLQEVGWDRSRCLRQLAGNCSARLFRRSCVARVEGHMEKTCRPLVRFLVSRSGLGAVLHGLAFDQSRWNSYEHGLAREGAPHTVPGAQDAERCLEKADGGERQHYHECWRKDMRSQTEMRYWDGS